MLKGWWLDLVTLVIFSSLNDSLILNHTISHKLYSFTSMISTVFQEGVIILEQILMRSPRREFKCGLPQSLSSGYLHCSCPVKQCWTRAPTASTECLSSETLAKIIKLIPAESQISSSALSKLSSCFAMDCRGHWNRAKGWTLLN